jgi:hypothetical protein
MSLKLLSLTLDYVDSVLFFMALQRLEGQDVRSVEASRAHWDTQTSDQPDAETSTWQHTKIAGYWHGYPGGIRIHNPSKQAAADPCFRPRDHRIVSF